MASETFTVNIEARNNATRHLVAVRDSLQKLQVQSTATAQEVKGGVDKVKNLSQSLAAATPLAGALGQQFDLVTRSLDLFGGAFDKQNAAVLRFSQTNKSAAKNVVAAFAGLKRGVAAQITQLNEWLLKNPVSAAAVAVAASIAFLVSRINAYNEAQKQTAKIRQSNARTREDTRAMLAEVEDEAALLAARKRRDEQLKQLKREAIDAKIEGDEAAMETANAKRKALRESFAEAEIEAEKRIEEKKLAARLEQIRKAREAEIAEMRKRADALRAELAKIENAQREAGNRAAAKDLETKIAVELDIAGVKNREELEAALRELREKAFLTEAEAAQAERLLAARERISALEQSAEAARASLQRKIALMEAEIAGTEQLAAAKEKLYRAEVKAQFLKAGYGPKDAEAATLRFLELEKQVERVRKERAEAEKAKNEIPAPESPKETRTGTRRDAGIVQTAQASIGGGRTLNLGTDSVLAIQRRQLSVQEQMLSAFKSFSGYKKFSNFGAVLS